jgi:hypothetical protein
VVQAEELEAEIEEMKGVFMLLDKDGNGLLDCGEVSPARGESIDRGAPVHRLALLRRGAALMSPPPRQHTCSLVPPRALCLASRCRRAST